MQPLIATKRLVLLGLASLFMGISCSEQVKVSQSPALVPLPRELSYQAGSYRLATQMSVSLSPEINSLTGEEAALVELLAEGLGREIILSSSGQESNIVLSLSSELSPEAYELKVGESGILATAGSTQGLRYAIQTLRQLAEDAQALSFVSIKDEPRFAYRGALLDDSRHMMGKEYILQLLSEMARLKLNYFHWHLVDGGGWRMESEHYPLLTQKAAYRTEEDWNKWWLGKDRRFVDAATPNAYGGYYSKADIREIVAHATKLGITILPEIEMPGHSNELFFAYPELFCRDTYDHSISDVCIGKEETFIFFERILSEVIDLFPGQYIHIGGDEAAMNHWGQCPRCKERMAKEGFKDLHELQSYMIKRIEKYLLSHGRKLIGWDETLEGGLAPEAVVMSWRGEEGGIKAAKAGHDVIMTPNNYLYLDYYQSRYPMPAQAFGGYITLEKVYSYDPVPESLSSEEQKHILGVQGNLWTEYIPTPARANEMYFPRLLAVAEVGWSPKEQKSWEDFRDRAARYTDRLISRGVSAYPLTGVNVDVQPSTDGSKVVLRLSPERSDLSLRYTLDGSEPTESSPIYQAPLETTDSLRLRLMPYRDGKALWSESLPIWADRHYGMDAKAISYVHPANKRYEAGGERSLIDGTLGTPTFLDKRWLGFTEPLDVTVDLGQEQALSHIYANFLEEDASWVFLPSSVEVWISRDGKEWASLGRKLTEEPAVGPDAYTAGFAGNKRRFSERYHFYTKATARYVRMLARIDRPQGTFIFVDELIIR